ncbi:MAG: DNA polymerase III subunit delta [Ilumatobacteraceae bacterium]
MTVYLVTGGDESIVRQTVHDLVHQLVGDGDRSLMVDEFEGDEYELRAVVDAAQTAPFLTESRVVVARDIGKFATDQLGALITYLGQPLPSTELVLVSVGGRVPKALTEAVKAAGGITTATTPPTRSADRQGWVTARADEHGLRLESSAAAWLTSWLGDEVGRLDGLLDTLVSVFGTDVRLDRGDIEPFIGDAGGVPPWDLTDAIDRGHTTTALTLLGRMLHGGERHPLQVMAILHNHYASVVRLDGREVRDRKEAAAVLGVKEFPAQKALENHRRLGGSGAMRAVQLLARADLDLRGDRDLSAELVMDVLVARLSRLSAKR